MFDPKNDKPIWEMLYDYVVNLNVGTVITNEQLSSIIGEPIEGQRSSIYKTRKELAKNCRRYLASVRGVGYRVIDGVNQLMHAENRKVKVKHQLDWASMESLNIDRKSMSAAEIERLDRFILWNGNVMGALAQNVENITKTNYIAGTAQAVVDTQLSELKSQIEFIKEQMGKMSR